MADFSMITARLATGAALSASPDVAQLAAAGVTAVVDCRAEFDDGPLFAQGGMQYLWNGTADDGQPKSPDWFAKSLDFALPILAKPRQKVYAHCAAGINRGPSTAYAILLALGWTGPVAEAIIRAARPQVGLRYKTDAESAVAALGYA